MLILKCVDKSGRQDLNLRPLAPQASVFRLSPSDAERFQQAEAALVSELKEVVRENAFERGWGLVGPPEITIEIDAGLKKGEFRCKASLVEGEEKVEPVPTSNTEPGTTYANAALPTRALSSSWVMGRAGNGLGRYLWQVLGPCGRSLGQTTLGDNSSIMAFVPYALTRPLLFGLDPERAHELTLDALAAFQNTPARCIWSKPRVPDPVQLAGLSFPNRIGLAAGLDKNGRCIDGLGAMGFGFVEVGTVTPKAQPGNAKPRMFRLEGAQALINRLGFNNDGLGTFIANVQRSQRFRASGGVLGLNIGKNAATAIERAADDYLQALEGVYPHADYVTINISSPNTQHLRALQGDAALDALLWALQSRKALLAAQHRRQVPMFVKIAPDLDDAQVKVIAAALRANGIDGVIATNTTLSRAAVQGLRHADESGGLSGAPLLEASNRVIAMLRSELGKGFPIIGVGGVMCAADALAKRAAGADLVQIYTGLIYRGPALVTDCARAMARR